jgi:molecular chaperone HscC
LHEKRDGTQFMILDLGGGTFDVSIVEYFDGVLEVHASSGDNHLGGEDFLFAMVENFFEQTGINRNKLSPCELQQVFSALETAKCRLSAEREIKVENIVAAQKQPWQLDRPEFEKLVQPLLHRVQTPIERTLRDADIHPNDIGEVVLVGGATRMHAFRSLISKMFRRMPAGNIDPDLVVAMGAGIQAGLKEKHGDLDDVVLTDVCPYTLGVEIINHNDKGGKQGGLSLPIIERNSIVPVSVEKALFTVSDNQSHVEVNIYQGESRLVKQNVFLGSLEVKVPKAPAGQEAIDVRYSYDMNGLLEVDVTVRSTGAAYHKTIINSPDSISPKEIEASKKKLAKLKFHPREQEENRALLARAERLYESSLSERRDYVGEMLAQFDKVLERQDPVEIKRAASRFKDILDELDKEKLF